MTCMGNTKVIVDQERPVAQRLSTSTHEFARQRVKYLVEHGGLVNEDNAALTRRPTSYVKPTFIVCSIGLAFVGGMLLGPIP